MTTITWTRASPTTPFLVGMGVDNPYQDVQAAVDAAGDAFDATGEPQMVALKGGLYALPGGVLNARPGVTVAGTLGSGLIRSAVTLNGVVRVRAPGDYYFCALSVDNTTLVPHAFDVQSDVGLEDAVVELDDVSARADVGSAIFADGDDAVVFALNGDFNSGDPGSVPVVQAQNNAFVSVDNSVVVHEDFVSFDAARVDGATFQVFRGFCDGPQVLTNGAFVSNDRAQCNAFGATAVTVDATSTLVTLRSLYIASGPDIIAGTGTIQIDQASWGTLGTPAPDIAAGITQLTLATRIARLLP